MPQGKMKVKAKMPTGAKIKNKAISKPKDIQKKNRPAQSKKDHLQHAVTKAINESNELAYKQKATVDGKSFRVIPEAEAVTKTENKKLDKGRLPKKK